MEVTAFDIHLMGSGTIFMELTSFAEFFIITVRKRLNFVCQEVNDDGRYICWLM